MRHMRHIMMFSLSLVVILVVIACGSPAAHAATLTQPSTPTLMPTPEPAMSPSPTAEPATSPPPTPTLTHQPAESPASTATEVMPSPSSPVAAEPTQVTLSPSKDNTLYEDAAGSLSNGAGQHFFSGNTSAGSVRRGSLLSI
jgi:outer membrane biosynthesis protein TonB